ncbi:hypothetical protein ACLOJK_024630 [Asimina triloba]
MQSVKVAWGGQTFALAKCSDSRGKKPRSRKTKEERRNMVESFIKKYRKSNNGNFPSLNLTHKEVGGSFYTVREIVREIIQENKVLGPAGFPLQEQYTSGTGSEGHQNPLSLSSAIGSSVDHKQPEVIFISKEDKGKPEELGRTFGEGSFNGSYDIVESKDSEMGKSYEQDSSMPQFIHEAVVVHQQQNMHSNGDVVSESLVEEERRKPSNTEKIEKKKDRLAHKEIFKEKMDVVEHTEESAADAVASKLPISEDVLSENKEDSSISKTEHLPELFQKSLADKSYEIDKASDSIDLQKASVVVDTTASEVVVPGEVHDTKIMADISKTERLPELVHKSLADESREIDKASDSIDLRKTLIEVDATASEVAVPEDMHNTKIMKDISKPEHLPELVHKSLADESCEIDKASDNIDLQKTLVEVVATASEVAIPNDAYETKIRTDIETGNGYIQIQEESSTDYVREPFSSASSSNVTFTQDGVSEVAQTSVANPSSEGLDFHGNSTSLMSGVPVLELNSTFKDADVDVSENDSGMLQSCNQPNLATKVEPVLVPNDAQVQKTATTNSGMTSGESADITAAAVITGEADLKYDSGIKNKTSNEMSSPSLTKENKKSKETHPFWVAIKALIDAFVKFWVDDL